MPILPCSLSELPADGFFGVVSSTTGVQMDILGSTDQDDATGRPELWSLSKFIDVSSSYSIRPGDQNAEGVVSELAGIGRKLGLHVGEESLQEQLREWSGLGSTRQPSYPTAFHDPSNLAPLPFSFYRFEGASAGGFERDPTGALASLVAHVQAAVRGARAGVSPLLARPGIEEYNQTRVRAWSSG